VPPVTVTVPPISSVTAPPVIQTEPPITATEPPVAITDPPVTATDPPVAITDPPIIATDPPATTETDPPVSTETTDPPDASDNGFGTTTVDDSATVDVPATTTSDTTINAGDLEVPFTYQLYSSSTPASVTAFNDVREQLQTHFNEANLAQGMPDNVSAQFQTLDTAAPGMCILDIIVLNDDERKQRNANLIILTLPFAF